MVAIWSVCGCNVVDMWLLYGCYMLNWDPFGFIRILLDSLGFVEIRWDPLGNKQTHVKPGSGIQTML